MFGKTNKPSPIDSLIGAGSTIHAGARLMAGCKLGAQVTVYPNAVLYENTIIGPRSSVATGDAERGVPGARTQPRVCADAVLWLPQKEPE